MPQMPSEIYLLTSYHFYGRLEEQDEQKNEYVEENEE